MPEPSPLVASHQKGGSHALMAADEEAVVEFMSNTELHLKLRNAFDVAENDAASEIQSELKRTFSLITASGKRLIPVLRGRGIDPTSLEAYIKRRPNADVREAQACVLRLAGDPPQRELPDHEVVRALSDGVLAQIAAACSKYDVARATRQQLMREWEANTLEIEEDACHWWHVESYQADAGVESAASVIAAALVRLECSADQADTTQALRRAAVTNEPTTLRLVTGLRRAVVAEQANRLMSPGSSGTANEWTLSPTPPHRAPLSHPTGGVAATPEELARARLDHAFRNYGQCLLIHYSCGMIAAAPHPTAIDHIVVKCLRTGQVHSFCSHDGSELAALKRFHAFAEAQGNRCWVNWNMRDATFGFEAIARRQAFLKLPVTNVPAAARYDLGAMLPVLYGRDYIQKESPGRWRRLAQLNGVTERNWLDEEAAAAAWAAGEFERLLASTQRKVEAMHDLFVLAARGDLKTLGRNNTSVASDAAIPSGEETSGAAPDDLITLSIAAALVKRRKRTLEIWNKKDPMPEPEVEGGGGKAHEYSYAKIRPWLERHGSRKLPAALPVWCRGAAPT